MKFVEPEIKAKEKKKSAPRDGMEVALGAEVGAEAVGSVPQLVGRQGFASSADCLGTTKPVARTMLHRNDE